MKTTQILKALNIVSNQYTRTHCSKLADIFSLLKEIKKDITEVLLLESELVYIGKTTEIKYRNREIVSNGIEMEGQKIQVTFTKGVYTFTLPIDNEFYFAVCELLKIDYKAKEIETVEVLQTITVESNVITAIKKASKIVSKDDLRPAMQCVMLHFTDKGCKVVSTDAHRLYYSRIYESNLKAETKLLLSPDAVKAISSIKDKGENITIELLPAIGVVTCQDDFWNKDIEKWESKDRIEDKYFALINGIKVELWQEHKYPDYECVIPKYEQKMVFNKDTFVSKMKQVLPYANKATNQIAFHLNGKIEMMAQDVDFSFESTSEMPYISKDFIDTDIAFNGKFLIECLGMIKAKEISMYHEGINTRGGIFTDGIDNCLLMPLMLNR